MAAKKQKKEKTSDKTIALVGGSFKPPTKGHWYMVMEYLKVSDEVKVIISTPTPKSVRKTKTGVVITPEMSKKIFEIFAKRYGVSDKVSVEVAEYPSSIRCVLKYAGEILSNCNVILGCSRKDDDLKRFNGSFEYFQKPENNPNNVNVLDPQKTAVKPFETKDGTVVSATTIRDNIDDKKIVKSMLPDKLTDADVDKIMKLLSGNKKTNESAQEYGDDFLRNYVDFDKSTIDYLGNMKLNRFFGPEETLCEIKMVGKIANDEIIVKFENYGWEIYIDGQKVSHSKKAYKSFVNGGEFKKLEKKLFRIWSEYSRYPIRMLKAARKCFASIGKAKYDDEQLKYLCAQKRQFLKKEFPAKFKTV